MWLPKRVPQSPPPKRGRVREGEAGAQSEGVFARFPHPVPPPTWGRGIFALLTVGSLATSTSPALAHTSERAFILLLPTGYYLVGGALAVAASFLILLALPPEQLKRWAGGQITLGRIGSLDETWTSLGAFIVLALLVAAGFLGSRDPLANPLPLGVWTLWWIGLTLAHALFGHLWRYLNPWVAPYRLIRAALGLRATPFRYRLGYWPAIIGFGAFAWFELVHPAPDDPAILARAVIAYGIVTWAGMALFGEEAWLGRGEAFSVFFVLIARIAPLQSEPIDHGHSLRLVVPGRALAEMTALPPSRILFVLLTLATVSFDGLNRTFWWLGLGGINPLEFPGRSAVMTLNSVGLIASWLVLCAVFLLCIAFGRRLGGARHPFWPEAGALAASILPISIGYQFAHYLTSFLVNGQYAMVAITDPFGLGWFSAEERMHRVTTSFLSNHAGVAVIWNLQAAGIVLGHMVAVLVAHLVAVQRQADGRSVLAFQLPLALLMVAYTIFGLWLLSTPAAG